jgi:hypothetical protein
MFTHRFGMIAGALILCTLLFVERDLALAGKRESGRYSIQFKDTSISDALNQLGAATRIRITMESVLDARITKSYRDLRIDEIIRDMFKNMSYVSVWTYGDKGVDSIDIRVFDEDKSPEAQTPLPENTRPFFDTPPVRRRVPPARTGSETDMAGSADRERDVGSDDRNDEEKEASASIDTEKEENAPEKTDETEMEKEDTAASTDEKEGTGADEDKASGSQ